LTLTGVGGCGKTSLAVELVREVHAGFPGGVFWLELAPLADPGMVAAALARSVGVRPLPGQTHLDAAVGFLAGRRALVVVDNCERSAFRPGSALAWRSHSTATLFGCSSTVRGS
jgi:predicted ATPase